MIELNTFKKILEENEERLPLLTLDEFFDGNTEEDSIAPNQWEFGRPTLSEIRNMLQKIELMPDIAWVRVALHDDTEIVENNGKEELVLAGDTIVICTTILPAELEKLVNCEWLCSDGVITIEAFELKILQFQCLTLCNSANGGKALIFRRFRHLPFGRVFCISRRIPA